jgi:MoxR-like ATPase
VQGKRHVVELALVAVLARGHLLLEDVPGVGKTTLANALAGALGGSFSRVQFTADLLPSDVLGVAILDPERRDFRFRPGPVFANVVLADEINRAPPRTQSALLEAMNAGRVSVDGVTRPLPAPFIVVATQNPHDHVGTFPLPDSQLDRFLLKLSMGYPDRESERAVLRAGGYRNAELAPALEPAELAGLLAQVEEVEVHADVEDDLLTVVDRSRSDARFIRGASTRAAEALYRCVKALATLRGRTYSVPEDLRNLVVPVLAHRVVARGEGRDAAARALRELLEELPAPGR